MSREDEEDGVEQRMMRMGNTTTKTKTARILF